MSNVMKRVLLLIILIFVFTISIFGCAKNPSDNINGMPANQNKDMSNITDQSSLIEMKYQPKQCQELPWETFYREGKVKFIKEPTEEELATVFFSDKGIELKSFEKIESGNMVCEACGACPTSYYYRITVLSKDFEKAKEIGFVQEN